MAVAVALYESFHSGSLAGRGTNAPEQHLGCLEFAVHYLESCVLPSLLVSRMSGSCLIWPTPLVKRELLHKRGRKQISCDSDSQMHAVPLSALTRACPVSIADILDRFASRELLQQEDCDRILHRLVTSVSESKLLYA